MLVKTIGDCCGALELLNFNWGSDYTKDLKDYLEGEWNKHYGTHKHLPYCIIGVTAQSQILAIKWLKASGFKPKKFQGIHPPTSKSKDLTLWTYIGDPQKFLGPINWKGAKKDAIYINEG